MRRRGESPLPLYEGCNTRIDWCSPELVALVASGALPQGRALDLGCGHGTEGLFLAECGWRVVGVDNDRLALRHALRRRELLPRQTRNRIEFKAADALKFRGQGVGSFDVAIDRLLMTNLENERQRASEIDAVARALRADGVFVLRIGLHEHPVGVLFPMENFFEELDWAVLRKYFDALGSHFVGYQGMITPSHDGENRVVANYPMGIAVFRRNDVPWSLAKNRGKRRARTARRV